MTTLRTFIALEVSQEARHALGAVITRLQDAGVSGIRWVRPEGIHLTLKFLGDVDASAVEGILSAMERACFGNGPIALSLTGLGAFPNASSPRVLWAGLGGELESLGGLQGDLDGELSESLGFSKETRPFSLHLTLGRLRDGAKAEERRLAGAALLEADPVAEVCWIAGELNLVRSILSPSGAEYSLLGSCRLGEKPTGPS